MEVVGNSGGGQSVLLSNDDKLSSVPPSHRDLISPEVQSTFADPVAYFDDVARRCPFPTMQVWLNGLLAEPRWKLELHMAEPRFGDSALVGFRWEPSSGHGALVSLPRSEAEGLPRTLRQYYSLVDEVHWREYFGSGGLCGVRERRPVSAFAHLFPKRRYPESLRVWGYDVGGNMLVYTDDDRGGWLEHEEGHVHWLGSIAETIEWVFAELLAGREPDAFPENAPPWDEDSG